MSKATRNYVNKTNCEGEMVWGIQYGTAEEARASECLDECFHVEQVNYKEGRWHLLLDRSDLITDDLPYLEMLLRLYIMEEGLDWDSLDGDFSFMAPGYSFGWIVVDAGPSPWDDDYGCPVVDDVTHHYSTAKRWADSEWSDTGRAYAVLPIAWKDGEDEYVCNPVAPIRLPIPAAFLSRLESEGGAE